MNIVPVETSAAGDEVRTAQDAVRPRAEQGHAPIVPRGPGRQPQGTHAHTPLSLFFVLRQTLAKKHLWSVISRQTSRLASVLYTLLNHAFAIKKRRQAGSTSYSGLYIRRRRAPPAPSSSRLVFPERVLSTIRDVQERVICLILVVDL